MLIRHHLNNRHFDPDYRRVKSAVQAGLAGDIVSLENRTMGARPAIGFGVAEYNPEWRITAAAGGGTMLDFGPHWTEQVLDLMAPDKVVQVFADVRNIKWGDAEDLFDIGLVFASGARARIGKADISYYGLPYKWLILGTEATLVDAAKPSPCTGRSPRRRGPTRWRPRASTSTSPTTCATAPTS